MRLAPIVSGLSAAALLTLGIRGFAPVGPLDTLCDVAGIASALMFLGLVEGA